MDLSLDENQQQIREMLETFVRSEVTPNAESWDASESLPRERLGALAELGMLGVMVPEACDGVGLGLMEAAVVLEELGRGDGGLAVAMASHAAVAAPYLAAHGSEESRDAWLAGSATGEHLIAWALGEASGQELDALETSASPHADGWVLTGHKALVPGGAVADLFLVTARVDDEVAVFVVPADARGLSCTSPGLLGLRGGGLIDVTLDEVRVPEGARLAGGRAEVAQAAAACRVAFGAVAAGLGRRAIEQAASYALERKQFGKAIAEFQAIQYRLADADVAVDGARLLTYRAAAAIDAGRRASGAAAMAYLQAAQAAFDAADHAIQIHGGYGYVREYDVERIWRDARTLAALAGTPAASRDAIAEHVYG